MWHTIHDFGVVFPKDQHGDKCFSIWDFSIWKWCTFALRPLNSFVSATMICKFKWCHILYGFGVGKYKDSNGHVHLVFCATQMDIVWSLNHFKPCPSFLCIPFNFSACWSCSSDHSNSVPCHLELFASLYQSLAYCHMQVTESVSSVAPSRCQFHRHFFVSGIDVLLSRCIYFC